jgi:hypothetical protein
MSENKALVGIVVGFAAVIIIGVVLVGYGVLRNASDFGLMLQEPMPAATAKSPAAKLAEDVAVRLEKGAQLVDWQATDTRLILHVRTASGEHRMILVDLATGAVLGRITVAPGPSGK